MARRRRPRARAPSRTRGPRGRPKTPIPSSKLTGPIACRDQPSRQACKQCRGWVFFVEVNAGAHLSCCAQRLDPFYLIEEQVFSRGPNTPKLHHLHGDCSGVLVTNGIGTPFVDQICELLDLRFEPGVRRQRDRKPMSERVFRRPQFPRTGPRTSAGARIFSVGDNPCRRFHATFCAPARRGAAESRRRGETRRPAVCRRLPENWRAGPQCLNRTSEHRANRRANPKLA